MFNKPDDKTPLREQQTHGSRVWAIKTAYGQPVYFSELAASRQTSDVWIKDMNEAVILSTFNTVWNTLIDMNINATIAINVYLLHN